MGEVCIWARSVYQHSLTTPNARCLFCVDPRPTIISSYLQGLERSMGECLMILAYLPWIRFHTDRILRQTLQRTRKRFVPPPNRRWKSRGHGEAEWVLSE